MTEATVLVYHARYTRLPRRQGTSMATEAPARSTRETWDDWLPPDGPADDRQLTRDELVAELRAFGVDVDADDFRFWESAGVLPRPIRRWYRGATRTMYPTIAINAVMELRELQKRGYTLKQIAPRLRLLPRWAWSSNPHSIDTDDVAALARKHEELTGKKIWQVKITFVDEDGREDPFHYFTQPIDSEE